MAGQNLFNNPAVGEYFRSFVAYGVIVIAIMLKSQDREGDSRKIKISMGFLGDAFEKQFP